MGNPCTPATKASGTKRNDLMAVDLYHGSGPIGQEKGGVATRLGGAAAKGANSADYAAAKQGQAERFMLTHPGS